MINKRNSHLSKIAVGGGGGGGGAGRGWSGKVPNFERPYFCQYSSELYQIFNSCALCGYIINFEIN